MNSQVVTWLVPIIQALATFGVGVIGFFSYKTAKNNLMFLANQTLYARLANINNMKLSNPKLFATIDSPFDPTKDLHDTQNAEVEGMTHFIFTVLKMYLITHKPQLISKDDLA